MAMSTGEIVTQFLSLATVISWFPCNIMGLYLPKRNHEVKEDMETRVSGNQPKVALTSHICPFLCRKLRQAYKDYTEKLKQCLLLANCL